MSPLLPRDEAYFEMLARLAGHLTTVSGHLAELLAQPGRAGELVLAIRETEHAADGLTHEIRQRLDETFVTPFDPEDILALATGIDRVIDLVEDTAESAETFGLTEVDEAACRLAGVLQRAAGVIGTAVGELHRPRAILELRPEMKRLEEEGDALFEQAVGALFAGRPDPLEVIKRKELYEKLEDAIDVADDVGDVLESVAIKWG